MHRVCDSDATACPSERSFTRAPLGPSYGAEPSGRASERAGGQARGAARLEETKGILFSGFSLAFAFFAGGATFGGEGVAAIRIKPIVPAGQREKGREE